MNRRKEPCRNFQRGSCQYGDRCKFLHVAPQQSKPNSNNPYGFGAQNPASQFQQRTPPQQHQTPNPFGFGVQNNNTSQLQPRAPSQSGGNRYQGPSKPFENKWIRPSTDNPSSQQAESHSQQQNAVHKCTDPESCKRLIADDFKNEAPLWKLTCYGHWKYFPCDIVGDISYEELRTAAYEDARRGLSLQAIVERERNLLNSKLIEFDNLLPNPSVASKNPNPAGTRIFPGRNDSAQFVGAQSNAAPLFSSFSQLGASSTFGSNNRDHALGTQSATAFKQPSPFQNNVQSSVGFEMKFGTSGISDKHMPIQASTTLSTPSTFIVNGGGIASDTSRISSSQDAPQFSSGPNNPFLMFPQGPEVAANTIHQAPVVEKQQVRQGDDRIWLKKEWAEGEIPDEEPPEQFR